MDAIASDPASDHVDDIARTRCLAVALAPVGETARHDADGPAVYQWLADVALVEDHSSVDRGDT